MKKELQRMEGEKSDGSRKEYDNNNNNRLSGIIIDLYNGTINMPISLSLNFTSL